MTATASRVPRLRCSGAGWSHRATFLTIRSVDPLVMQCPICGNVEHVDE